MQPAYQTLDSVTDFYAALKCVLFCVILKGQQRSACVAYSGFARPDYLFFLSHAAIDFGIECFVSFEHFV